jgi:hypothetical protein
MKNTWASGALELLKHAEDHSKLNTSFDRKIAFISIDNSVELTLKSFLSLPKRYFGEKRPTRKELDEAYNSFTNLLDLTEKYANNKLNGIEINDIEHYHRIRNTLYHQGTGLSPNEEYVELYLSIAKILLYRLFDIQIVSNDSIDKSIYSEILIGWSQIDKLINDILNQRNIETKTQFKWKIFQENKLSDKRTVELINNIRKERNRIAHTNSFEEKPSPNILNQINEVKDVLQNIFNSYSKKNETNFFYYPSISKIQGQLTSRTFFGPPNYGEDPENDRKEKAYIIKLKEPVNVISKSNKIEEGDFDITRFNIREVQIVSNNDLTDLINKDVNASGTFFGAHTGHHRTEVLLEISQIEKI